MTTVQLGLLLAILAPVVFAIRMAFPGRPAATRGEGLDRIAGRPGHAPSGTETMDLAREVRVAADALEALAREHLVEIEMAVGQATPSCVDPIIRQTVLRCALAAAIRATPGGRVLVVAAIVGRRLCIRTVDDGASAASAPRESLLREAEELVVPRGGSIVVEAAPGEGTTVTVTLPLPGDAWPETDDSSAALEMIEPEARASSSIPGLDQRCPIVVPLSVLTEGAYCA